MSPLRRGWLLVGLIAVGAGLAACAIVVSSSSQVVPLQPGRAEPYFVKTPVRAHLRNGDLVVFEKGATISPTRVVGLGLRFDAARRQVGPVDEVQLSSVIGLESFIRKINEGRTALYAPVSMAASALVDVVLAIAIFGSCPTIYADSAGTPVLQAEAFSYSIAPLLAKRDVDRLDVRPDSNGVVRLEVRNEALETHYIDQMELLEVRHASDELALPAAKNGIVALKNLSPVAGVRDARGRDVSSMLSRADGSVFTSDRNLLAEAVDGRAPAEDFLDLAIPREGRDSLAIALTMRSSLMSTVVFYEYMMGRAGARSIDWVGHDLSRITTVAQVARWYTSNFGLRVLVREGKEWRQVVRLMDFGPVAWRTVAALLTDLPHGDTTHVRLAFAPDEFQIDRIGVTADLRRVEPRKLPLARVVSSQGSLRADAHDFLGKADDRHLVTEPGNRFYAEFDAGRATETRTFLIAADGYYVEWLRPSWVATSVAAEPFSTRTTKQDILRSWMKSKDSLEARFFKDRVPVL